MQDCNFMKACRTCLSLPTLNQVTPIPQFVVDFLEIDLGLNSKSIYEKKFPQSVCLKCFGTLRAFQNFYLQCRNAHEILLSKIQEHKHINEKVEKGNQPIKKCFEFVQYESEFLDEPVLEISTDDHFLESNQKPIKMEDGEKLEELEEILNDHDEVGAYEVESILADNVEIIEEVFSEEDDLIGFVEEDISIDGCNYSNTATEIQMTETIDRTELKIENNLEQHEIYHQESSNEENELIKSSPNQVVLAKPGYLKRKFQCNLCDKRFSNRYDLAVHQNIHSGIKPFECNVCGNRFGQKNTLKTHQTLHFGKPIICEECGKKFARKSQLILHNRMHRDERPFECDQCQKSFRQKQDLVAHQMIHSGIKNFQCSQCPSKFYNRKSLSKHIRDYHRGIIYGCNICVKRFNKAYKLRKHFLSCHNVQIDNVSHFKRKSEEKQSVIDKIDDVEELVHDVHDSISNLG